MKRSILIYSNCQGEELQRAGNCLPCLDEHVQFKWIPLHKVTEPDWRNLYGPEFMADVAAVWEQVEAGPPTDHRRELHDRIPKDCQVVRFPPLSALCIWPFAGNDPRLAADPDRYHWSDSIAAALASENLPHEAAFERYMQISTERMPDLERRLRLDVGRWQATDALSDFKLSEWVQQKFRTTKLFHTMGHLTAEPTRYIFPQLVQRTSAVAHRTSQSQREIDLLLRYNEGQDHETVPVHPLVAQRLQLRYFDPDARYRWHAHDWTFKEYIIRYINWATYMD